MLRTIKGPAIFLAQFAGDAAPYNSLSSIARWAADHGYAGVQIPSWDARLFDLRRAAESRTYCDEVRGILADAEVELTELSTHLQGQLVAVHPAYDVPFDGFAAPEVRGNPAARTAWATEQLMLAARASRNLGLTAHATFSGALAWPYIYPWPQRPAGLVETAFDELARRWRPILDAFDEAGVDVCYEIHPGEDLHDGVSYEMFLDRVGGHKRACLLYDPSHFVLQQLDYLGYIDAYHERIRAFHVKDAEFNATAKQGVYGGFQSWVNRAGRFRSLGDGQVDFGAIFSKLSQYRLRRLGGDGVGVLHQGQRAGCGRRCAVHRRPYHPGRQPRLRRFRGERHGSRHQPETAGDRLNMPDHFTRRLRLGMVGGGSGAFIGGVHRIAARIDDQYELVAGALSADPARAHDSAAALHIPAERSYDSFAQMAQREATRPDGIDVVAIVTPNHLHHAPAKAFAQAGISVICDKPLTSTLDDAQDLARVVQASKIVFALTHNYTGYPLVRQARAMVAAGEIGVVRTVQVEYAQDWLTTPLEETGHKQAEWRTDPARSGGAGSVGDIGTHAFNLAEFVCGLEVEQLAAELSRFVPGRRLDDNAQMLLRFGGGARGALWCSQVAPGNENALRLRVYGEKAGLEWAQEQPNALVVTPHGEPPRVIRRAGAGTTPVAAHASRIPAGHPEGYLEAFAQLYRDVAEQIIAHKAGRAPDPASLLVPGIEAGLRGMRFITAAVASSHDGATWHKV